MESWPLVGKLTVIRRKKSIICLEMVMALISSASDESSSVRSAISKSLNDIGKKQPNLVLSSCYDFLSKNQKVR
jgi:hypothetical protein